MKVYSQKMWTQTQLLKISSESELRRNLKVGNSTILLRHKKTFF